MHLNKEVRKINYDVSNTGPDRIKIECSDGSEYTADHLICTVSLGVLKKYHSDLFEPRLPRYKIDTIEGIGFGTVDKIFVEFTKPFWNAEWEGVSCLWKSDQLRKIREDPINGHWMSHIIGFYTVSFQPNILCGWITGEAARKMEEVSDEDVKIGIQYVLKLFLKDWKDSEIKNIVRYVKLLTTVSHKFSFFFCFKFFHLFFIQFLLNFFLSNQFCFDYLCPFDLKCQF